MDLGEMDPQALAALGVLGGFAVFLAVLHLAAAAWALRGHR